MSYHSYNIGDVPQIGENPYKITGDPVIALIAQLNRFAGKTISPGGKCNSRDYLPAGALPLATTLNDRAATIANVIVYDSLDCIDDERLKDFRAMAKVREGLMSSVPWAMTNLSDITVRIAQFADSKGLSPADVGITEVDKKIAPKFPTMTVALVGGLAVAAYLVSRRK